MTSARVSAQNAQEVQDECKGLSPECDSQEVHDECRGLSPECSCQEAMGGPDGAVQIHEVLRHGEDSEHEDDEVPEAEDLGQEG